MAQGAFDNRHIDKIGDWTETKLEIIRKYAAAYSTILAKRPGLRYIYIDGFCGAGLHESRSTGDFVEGSPIVALGVDPPFHEYHFIDLDRGKTQTLRTLIESRELPHYNPGTVHIYDGDCNEVLLETVFPRAQYRDYRRALCLLDPYGLHLSWEVIATAGSMKSVEIFLNFPISDMNRNVLLRDASKIDEEKATRLTEYWGDESWRDAAYCGEEDLFGHPHKEPNHAVVRAFRDRLKTVAGFPFVPEPVPMRTCRGADIYYLFFASHNQTGAKITRQIFSKYGKKRS